MSVPAPVVIFTHRKTLWQYRRLLLALAGRDIRARYRQSFLGVYWSVLNPLLQTAVYAVVLTKVLHVPSETVPFAVLYFSGVMYWNFFTTAVTGAMGSVTTQVNLLEKHRFPIAVLRLASFVARSLDFAISAVVLVVLCSWYGVALAPTAWAALPLLVVAGAAAVGAGLLTAGLHTLYRDVGHLVNLSFTLGFFLTPIIYDVVAFPPRYRFWLLLNPVAATIHGTRLALFAGTVPPLEDVLPGTLVAIAVLVIGVASFRRLQATFTEVL